MPVHAEYDREADALYLRLAEGEVVRSDAIDHAVTVDLAEDDVIVGVEILAPHRHLAQLPVLAERYSFVDRLGQAVGEVRRELTGLTYSSALMVMSPVQIDAPTMVEAMSVASGSISWGTSETPRELDANEQQAVEPV